MTEWFVYAKRRGSTAPRPLAGPYPTRGLAIAYRERAHALGVVKHYVSRHSDDVYVGAARSELADQVGILNRWLNPAPVPAEA
jgi:hypothetical protein